MIIFPILVLCLLGTVVGREWHQVFKDKLREGKYSEASQIKEWTDWITIGDLEIHCIDSGEHKRKTGKELKAADTLKHNEFRRNVGATILGKSLKDQRCELLFPAKGKSLLEIFELLWGFTKVGFSGTYDPDNGYKQITTLVTIKFKGNLEHRFRLQMDTSNGQVMYSNLREYPNYLDFSSPKNPGKKKEGCFCNMDRAVNKVGITKE